VRTFYVVKTLHGYEQKQKRCAKGRKVRIPMFSDNDSEAAIMIPKFHR
jgi:hypothetical protein